MNLSSTTTALILAITPADAELLRLRGELRDLRAKLAATELVIGDLRGQLLSFEGRYIRQVGKLYQQLDEWEKKRAALHPKPDEELEDNFEDDASAFDSAAHPLQSLRALFREVAKRIHPDFANDADDELRRTRLMTQANDAFLRGDRGTLERMLHGHDVASPLRARATEAELAYAREQIGRLRQDIAHAHKELNSLRASELATLRQGVIDAAQEGRDLLAEMARRVQALIGLAMRQYELDIDRIKNPPRGLKVETLLSAETPEPSTPRYDPKRRKWIRPGIK